MEVAVFGGECLFLRMGVTIFILSLCCYYYHSSRAIEDDVRMRQRGEPRKYRHHRGREYCIILSVLTIEREQRACREDRTEVNRERIKSQNEAQIKRSESLKLFGAGFACPSEMPIYKTQLTTTMYIKAPYPY